MLLIEAIEEISEKIAITLSVASMIRKINDVRGQILRTYGRKKADEIEPLIDMNDEIGIDPTYDRLVVLGVLKMLSAGNDYEWYAIQYEQLLADYLRSTNEVYQIQYSERVDL